MKSFDSRTQTFINVKKRFDKSFGFILRVCLPTRTCEFDWFWWRFLKCPKFSSLNPNFRYTLFAVGSLRVEERVFNSIR